MKENKEIQKRLRKTLDRREESRDRAFLRNMLLGKIGPAAKFINNEDAVKGVHTLTPVWKVCTFSGRYSACTLNFLA